MEGLHQYRFERTRRTSSAFSVQYDYTVRDTDMKVVAYCQTKNHCRREPTLFKHTADSEKIWFLMKPHGRVGVTRYSLHSNESERPFAGIVGSKTLSQWVLFDSNDCESFRIVDPRSMGLQMLENLFMNSGREYAVIRADSVIGTIRRAPVEEQAKGSSGHAIVWALAKRLLPPRLDWVLSLHLEAETADRRLLIAGVVLLHEWSIRLSGSG